MISNLMKLTKLVLRLYVAVNRMYIGCIIISDSIKEDSYNAITGLREKRIRKLVMLTGDN